LYKRGTPEYDRWKASPAYDLWRERNAMAHKGKRHSAEACANMSAAKRGERNPNYGKPRSEETKRKISIAHKGKSLSKKHKQKISVANKGKLRSKETKQKIAAARRGRPRPDLCGSNNHFWRGGIFSNLYPVGWTALLRETIRKRDNYTCALCGEGQNGRKHSVHHIDYKKKNLCPENLITLCPSCHRKTNDDREYWENLFTTIMSPISLK